MKGKLLAFAFAVFGVATIGIAQIDVKAEVDNTRDCDKYAVVYCGTLTPQEARNKYDQKDHAKIFQSMGILRGDLDGSFREGVVYQDGRVVVGGKTVATGATMAARGLGGTPIAGTGASKVSVSQMGSAQTAMVKMNGDRFVFAVMKPCGNPVKATPKQTPPPPTPEPTPKAECAGLTQEKISDTRYRYRATAETSGGAKVRGYDFTVQKNGQEVDTNRVQTANLNSSYTFDANGPGKYTVKVTVNTTEGQKTGPECQKSFEVKRPPAPNQPGVEVEKYVNDDQKYARVGVNVEYSYRIVVRNTGDTDLKNVVVTDTADDGITLISVTPPNGTVDENTWTYTIPTLMKSEEQTYTLKAKVPAHLAGKLKNTVCVDAPEVSGNPDDCDEAEVDVPPIGKVQVCDPATGEIIEVDETETDKYVPVGSPECEDTPVVEVEDTPDVLPETGTTDTILSVIGAMSLAGSSAYYLASRRSI